MRSCSSPLSGSGADRYRCRKGCSYTRITISEQVYGEPALNHRVATSRSLPLVRTPTPCPVAAGRSKFFARGLESGEIDVDDLCVGSPNWCIDVDAPTSDDLRQIQATRFTRSPV